MTSQKNNTHYGLPHNIGHEPTILGLRAKHYAESELYASAADESGAPLTRFFVVTDSERGTKYRCLTHPGSYYSPSLVGTESWSSEAWAKLARSIRSIPKWAICRFSMLNSAQSARLAAATRRQGFNTIVSEAQFRVLSGSETYNFKSYVEARRSSFNRNQNRCRRLMDKNGFVFTTQLDLEQVFKVFASRHQVKGAEDYSVKDNFRSFLRELRDSYQAQGRWYEIGIEKDGVLAAFTLGFWDDDNVFYAFQTGYDPAYHNLRLGALTFDRLIEDVLSKGCRYISFMGDSEYFRLFTDEVLRFDVVEVFSRSPAGYFLYYRRQLMRLGSLIKRRVLPLLKRGEKPAPPAPAAT